MTARKAIVVLAAELTACYIVGRLLWAWLWRRT